MVQRFEKIYTRAELNKKDMRQLKDICKRIKIASKPSKVIMVNHILNWFRNQYNLGLLSYSFFEEGEEKTDKKEKQPKQKPKAAEKPEQAQE